MSGEAALFRSVVVLMLILSSVKTQPVIPSQYTTAQSVGVPSANGSSPTGNCSPNATSSMRSSVLNVPVNITKCTAPASSVLFDGIIPTLSGLDGNMWASQLLTLHTPNRAMLNFDFHDITGYVGVDRVEVVIVNCPDMGIAVKEIKLTHPTSLRGFNNVLIPGSDITPMNTSCDSLVTVHMPCEHQHCNKSLLGMEIHILSNSIPLVYIAEIRFCGANNCPSFPSDGEDIIISSTTSESPPLNPTTNTTSTPPPDETIGATTVNINTPCLSCSISNILASVLTAISTALLATVLFVLVQIALCKCHPKATPGGAESAPSAGENRQAMYEQVDIMDEGGVAVSDTTYAEVQPGGKDTFALKTNEAYAVP